jgi:hypothetical protein
MAKLSTFELSVMLLLAFGVPTDMITYLKVLLLVVLLAPQSSIPFYFSCLLLGVCPSTI